jgi:hypothetical protein
MLIPGGRGSASSIGSACDELTLNPHPLPIQTPKGAPTQIRLRTLRLGHPPGDRYKLAVHGGVLPANVAKNVKEMPAALTGHQVSYQ